MTGHEGMRLLILSRFEDDVLLRQEVEAWLAELAPLGQSVVGESLMCVCAELGLCYCNCEGCAECEDLLHVPEEELPSDEDTRGENAKQGRQEKRAVETKDEKKKPKRNREKKRQPSSLTPVQEPVEVEIVPGMKVMVYPDYTEDKTRVGNRSRTGSRRRNKSQGKRGR